MKKFLMNEGNANVFFFWQNRNQQNTRVTLKKKTHTHILVVEENIKMDVCRAFDVFNFETTTNI